MPKIDSHCKTTSICYNLTFWRAQQSSEALYLGTFSC